MDGHAANDLKDDFMFFKNYSHIILAKFYNYAIILIDYSNVDSQINCKFTCSTNLG